MDDGGASRCNCARFDNEDQALVDRHLLDRSSGNSGNGNGNIDGSSKLYLLILSPYPSSNEKFTACINYVIVTHQGVGAPTGSR